MAKIYVNIEFNENEMLEKISKVKEHLKEAERILYEISTAATNTKEEPTSCN